MCNRSTNLVMKILWSLLIRTAREEDQTYEGNIAFALVQAKTAQKNLWDLLQDGYQRCYFFAIETQCIGAWA